MGNLVNSIQVGSFLTVYLDTNEMIVHDFGDLLILETFAFHDMAPVAGGISDRQEDWPV